MRESHKNDIFYVLTENLMLGVGKNINNNNTMNEQSYRHEEFTEYFAF
jgi:hypothetical protein